MAGFSHNGVTMTNPEIARLRLASAAITRKFDTPAEAVRHIGALQAQDYQASLWAIGVRTTAATVADIDAAIERREIARTWPMRGTLHWLPADDLRWMVDLMAPRAIAKAAARHRQLEIDDAVAAKARKLLTNQLRDGGTLTRPQAYALMDENDLAPAGQRGIHILSILAHEGTICFGPHQGKQPAFVLADEWLPPQRKVAGDEAVAELARRYLMSHGPATVHDFAWWTGLTITTARAGVEAVKRNFERLEADGTEYWYAPRPGQASKGDIHLLPGFDEYILGYQDRSAVVSPEHMRRLLPGKNGIFLASIVSGGGEVLGTWRRTTDKRGTRIDPEMFDGRAVPAGLQKAAKRFAAFLGTKLIPGNEG